jgi:hypothetical protein
MMNDAASIEAATRMGFGKRGSVFGSRNHDGQSFGGGAFVHPGEKGVFLSGIGGARQAGVRGKLFPPRLR